MPPKRITSKVMFLGHCYEGARVPEFDGGVHPPETIIVLHKTLDVRLRLTHTLSMQTEEVTPTTVAGTELEIYPLRTAEDAAAFKSLNEEWIRHYFTLEPKDIATLNDPAGAILAHGGQIFLVTTPASAPPAACVALIPMGDGTFEVSKMAVSPSLRGLGIGRRLLLHAIAQAPALGAKRLFLGSNSILANAVHLYESIGFTHLPPERRPALGYARADVYMEMDL